MKIVYFGTSSFGIPTLEALKGSHHEILSIVTTPDKTQGRHLNLKSSPIKNWAQKNDLPYIEVSKKSILEVAQVLKNLSADLFVVISFGLLLPKNLIEIPKLMTLNVHSSLLPKYRGAAPMHWALLNDDKETGVTIMRLVEKLDAGNIAVQKKVAIEATDDYRSLEAKLEVLGAGALLEVMGKLEIGEQNFVAQDESLATYARKITKEDGHVSWQSSAKEVLQTIRALRVWPKAYSFYKTRRIIIADARALNPTNERQFSPGTIVEASREKGIIIAMKGQWVELKLLQLEGRKVLPAAEFLNGFSMEVGQVLE